jgi:hypothetical protein
MLNWAFYPVFVGVIVSVIGLSRIARKERGATVVTLSELAAAEEALLKRFRNILMFCGVLFAITLFGFIVPRTSSAVLVFGVLMIGGELLAAVILARGKTSRTHLVLAEIMAVGMLGLGVSFALVLTGGFSVLEVALTIGMVVSALLTVVNKKRYISHELAFIFSSHFSVLAAAITLR